MLVRRAEPLEKRGRLVRLWGEGGGRVFFPGIDISCLLTPTARRSPVTERSERTGEEAEEPRLCYVSRDAQMPPVFPASEKPFPVSLLYACILSQYTLR